MTKAKTVDADADIKKVLMKIITAAQPFQSIVKKGSQEAGTYLFANRAKNNGPLASRLESESEPLVETVDIEGKSWLKLTMAGADLIQEDVISELRKKAVTERMDEIKHLIETCEWLAPKLVELEEESQADLQKARDEELKNRAAQIEREKQEKSRVEAIKAALDRRLKSMEKEPQQRVEHLRKLLALEGVKVSDANGEEITRLPEREDIPESPSIAVDPPKDARDWIKHTVDQFVAVWLQAVKAQKPEAQRTLEVALARLKGLRRIGQKDEVLPYNPKQHKFHEPVASPSSEVVVVQAGWWYSDGQGLEVLITPALVRNKG